MRPPIVLADIPLMRTTVPAPLEPSDLLDILTRSGLLDPEVDEALDRLTNLATIVLRAPAAFVSFLAGEHLFIKSQRGLPERFREDRFIPLTQTLCAEPLRSGEPLVISDVQRLPEIPTNSPAALQAARAYAAVPLARSGGDIVGVFAVMDTRVREWGGQEISILRDLSASVLREVEWRIDAVNRARSADVLRQSEERFRLMVEGSEQVFFYTHDLSGRFEYVSPSVRKVLGYAPEEVIGLPYTALLAGDGPGDAVVEHTARSQRGDSGPSTYSAAVRHRDGRTVLIEIVESAVRCGDKVIGVQGFARDITERRRSEEELRLRTAHLEQLLESAPEAIVVLGTDDQVLRVNREFTRMFGYSAEEAVGRTVADLIVPDSRKQEASELTVRVGRGETVSVSTVRKHREGRSIHVSILATPVLVDGAHAAVYGIYRDISDQVRAEEAVRRSEEKFRSLIEHSAEVIDILDAAGVIRYVTPSVRRVLGREPDEVIGRSVFELLHPGDRDRAREAFHSGLTMPNSSRMLEARVQHADGSWRVFESSARNLLDDPAVAGIVITSRDVTTRKAAAAELQRNAAILASIRDSVVVTDLDGVVTYWNDGATRLFGWSQKEMVGSRLSDRRDPEFAPRLAEETGRVLAGEELHGEFEEVRKDGSRILTDTRVSLIRDDAGQPSAILRIARDITEQRLLGRVLEEMPEAVICLDATDRIIFCNAAAVRTFGYTQGELLGQPVHILSADPEYTGTSEVLEIAAATQLDGGWTGEVVRRRKDGTHFPARLTTGVVRDSHGRVIGQAGLIRDLTDEKQRDAQLRRAERFASLGTLLGGLTHELNNPLTSIKSFAQLMLLDSRTPEDQDGLEVIQQEAERAARLVADLRLITRQTQNGASCTREAIDLNELVRNVLQSRTAPASTHGIEILEDLASDLFPVWGERRRLEQMVQQLVINGEKAVLGGAEARRVVVRTRSSRDGVSLTVIDSGAGIEPAHMDRIFDPFWTTRAPGEGVGLGLSVVQSVVTEHGGTIEVDSERGRGSSFRVELPWAASSETLPSARGTAPSGCTPLRILVVDDERPIRESLAQYLVERGHHVDTAAHGREALERIHERADYHVIVSDLRMPGLQGDELFERLAARGDGMEQRMIIMTGELTALDAHPFLAEADLPILLKPFLLSEVAQMVENHPTVLEPPVAHGP
jgi:two-component system, cell cycle sensor histidine kinase and response regulator CckA